MNQYVTGAVIKKLRQKNNMTQAQLADQLGVSDKTVSKWETGKGYPDITLLEPIAQAFRVSVAELLSGSPVQNANVSANMLRSQFYVCPICGNVIHSIGEAAITCHGLLLQPEMAEESDEQHKIFIEKAEDEYYVRVQHEMTKTHYISFIAAVSSERIQLVKRYPEEEAEARFKMQGVRKIFFFCNKDGLFSMDVKKGIDDKEAAYSDHEIRRKQEKIMDIFYQFGELMNLDPCDEKVQKAAEELHEIAGGQKQVVIEMLNNKYWKKAIRVAGGNGSLEFARKVMQEFYQTR